MGLLNVIRRLALREKVAIREIARRTGLSRNTIKKYLNAWTIEPKFSVPERPSKLDPFADKLAAWLKAEASTSRKQRRTLKHMHADLIALGFSGSYNRVAAFAREWRAERQREQQTTGDRDMVDILALVLQHDEQAVLAAVELALSDGVATKTHVLNILHRLIDGKPTDGRPSAHRRPCSCAMNPRPMSNAMMTCAPAAPEAVMRHDPASAAIVIMLRSLKMYGLAQAVTDLIEQGGSRL